MAVEAVFFDLDDTLVLTHAADAIAHQAVQRLLSPYLPSHQHQEAVINAFVEAFIAEPWDLTNQVDVKEWRSGLWNRSLKAQGLDDICFARELQTCFDKERLLAFQWAEGVEELIRTLRERNIKVGIITNGHPTVQRAKLNACRAQQLFDTVLVGGEEINEKPHKDIFLKACKHARCRPEHAIMVGDNLMTDIQGGLNAGFLATVWVNLHKINEPSPGNPKPHYTITNIVDLWQVLKDLGFNYG